MPAPIAVSVIREQMVAMDSSYAHRVERSKKLTLEERFNDTLEVIDLSRELMKAGIRTQFPDADGSRPLLENILQELRGG